jgi:hypothetical protein
VIFAQVQQPLFFSNPLSGDLNSNTINTKTSRIGESSVAPKSCCSCSHCPQKYYGAGDNLPILVFWGAFGAHAVTNHFLAHYRVDCPWFVDTARSGGRVSRPVVRFADMTPQEPGLHHLESLHLSFFFFSCWQ